MSKKKNKGEIFIKVLMVQSRVAQTARGGTKAGLTLGLSPEMPSLPQDFGQGDYFLWLSYLPDKFLAVF